MRPEATYTIDPEDPRAPPTAVWDALSVEARRALVAALPPDVPSRDAALPEGDAHFNAKAAAKSTLSSFFRRIRRSVYVASELAVYYPGEPAFAPDLLAVLDVEDMRERDRWVVSAEERGIDLVIEVHVSGSRRKDLVQNVDRYARLGIREYFIFDRGRVRLLGYRLQPRADRYVPIVPQGGRFESEVLDLDIEGTRLRFYHGTAPLLADDELTLKLEELVDQIEARAVAAEERIEEAERRREEEERRREEEVRRREEEERRRADAEAKLAAALAELERLRR